MIIKITYLNNEIILTSRQTFKSEVHNAYTEEINEIALSSNDDKRLQIAILLENYTKQRCLNI